MLMLSLLTGCTPTVEPAKYLLTLIPEPLGNQGSDILDFEPDVKVRLTSPDGEHELYYAGAARPGEALELTKLPRVPADTVVALIAEAPGGPTDVWNRTATIAYGEATLDPGVAAGDEVELTIPWARVDAVGRMGAFGEADRRVAAALVRLPGASGAEGSVLVFGGARARYGSAAGAPTNVVALVRTDEGWATSFAPAGVMPATWHGQGNASDPLGYASAKNVGLSATPIVVDGRPSVLVAGGRYPTESTSFHNPYWFLWDAESGEVAGGGLAEEGSTVRPGEEPGCVAMQTCGPLFVGRSEHVAAQLGANKVLLYGGLNGLGLPPSATYDIWNAGTRASAGGTIPDAAPFYVAGTSHGAGAVVCGGAHFVITDPEVDTWAPSVRCVSFRPNETYTDFAPLPTALAGAAMAQLPDGGLLITGGFDTPLDSAKDFAWVDTAPARSAAWRWDPDDDTWREVGDLVEPRAFHQAVALADGRVMLVGGVSEASVLFGPIADAVRCVEIFDPDTEVFTTTGCNDAGAGANPAVGGDPVTGWAVVEGADAQGGGAVFGIVGGQPLE